MCSCLKLRVNASLRSEIIRTEYEFIRLMELKGKLSDYKKVLNEVKYTWGLCPECDQKLRASLFSLLECNESLGASPFMMRED